MMEKHIVEKTAIEITSLPMEVLKQYGELYHLYGNGEGTGNTCCSSGAGWKDCATIGDLLDTRSSLGYTEGDGTPFVCCEMECHLHTKEAQIPISSPICFCMGVTGDTPPHAEEILPVILRPGYVFVLHRGIWHSSSHGLETPTGYYWLAFTYENEPTVWKPIKHGPVQILKGEPA